MSFLKNILIGLLSLTATVDATAFTKRTTEGNQIISFPVSISKRANASSKGIGKREQFANIPVTYGDENSAIFVHLSVGTPAKDYTLVLDTGSPFTWITAYNVTALNSVAEELGYTERLEASALQTACPIYGCYEYDSSTFRYDSSEFLGFMMVYGDNSTVLGYNVEDQISINGLSLSSFQFGIAVSEYESSSPIGGIMGISPQTSIYGIDEENRVVTWAAPTLLQQFKDAGVISSNSFSLFLSENSGEFILGGYDEDKFTGNLQWLPISSNEPGFYGSYLDHVTFHTDYTNDNNGCSCSTIDVPVQQDVIFDCGTTVVNLPAGVQNQITAMYNGVSSTTDCTVTVECDAVKASDSLDFVFSNNAAVTIPMSEFLIANGDGTCSVAFCSVGDSDMQILGLYFMKSIYTVYDWEAQLIGIAPAVDSAAVAINDIATAAGVVANNAYSAEFNVETLTTLSANPFVQAGVASPTATPSVIDYPNKAITTSYLYNGTNSTVQVTTFTTITNPSPSATSPSFVNTTTSVISSNWTVPTTAFPSFATSSCINRTDTMVFSTVTSGSSTSSTVSIALVLLAFLPVCFF
ncbi:aspartic proteinase sxa1 [Schizosaccharomyces japonicus yFS275]|uniref:Aspartic proteinase sxa1 n=1 Tax=Schizosaccharomyces japonicus (strain yFS275 / FY16936) TaxID=402676 RepID=B6JXH0_SCHJY|nr:aspartic proteinase sxa1 [Schizosaccharomyces japonicus yFS275]EEB05114.1 aspartic proteinase sxa1 [Schizosaccharomyces japonicus yFS275]